MVLPVALTCVLSAVVTVYSHTILAVVVNVSRMILRPVYPLKVFGVLQLAKKCNLRPKSVICGEHPFGIIQPDTMKIWTTVCMIHVYSTKSNSVGGVDFLFVGTTFKTMSRQQKLCVHNKAIIMEICKLPTYQNICDRIGCCKG